MCRAGNVPRSLVPNTRLARTERGLFQAVLYESWKESLKGPLPNFIEDFCGFWFFKDCENLVDSTLAKNGIFCVRVLTQLNTLMHGTNDNCFG